MAVSSQEGSWTEASTGRTYAYRLWKPSTTQALLVLLHGFGEHSGRYHQLATSLAERGICVAAPDLWGHGRSGGARGDLGDVTRCVNDLATLTRDTFLSESGQARYALFGHSFGGLAAICWTLNEPHALRCLIAQSPLLEVGFPVPIWKRVAAAVLATSWPTYSLSTDLDVGALSHDPAVVQAYRVDPLVHNKMSARTYRSILHVRDDAARRAHQSHVPTLLLCGGGDRIISLKAARRWYDSLTCEKRIVEFPNRYHELHHEDVQDQIDGLVQEWVLTHATST